MKTIVSDQFIAAALPGREKRWSFYEADGFIKGGRFFDIGDRQIHENHPRHRTSPFRGGYPQRL
jgi:hypothetical protein